METKDLHVSKKHTELNALSGLYLDASWICWCCSKSCKQKIGLFQQTVSIETSQPTAKRTILQSSKRMGTN